MLRSDAPHVVLQECPGEIALCFSIYGCPLACNGCHSPELWNEDGGQELTDALLTHYLQQYHGLITAVIFFGGEWQPTELKRKLQLCRRFKLKTCLYSGLTGISRHLKPWLDYAKLGPWIAHFGGLNQTTTNQVFVRLEHGQIVEDITYQFTNNKNAEVNHVAA